MSKYFLLSFFYLSIVFSFFSDSHIGNEEKEEVGYMSYPAITSFTDAPKEGRLRLSFNYVPSISVTDSYDDSGEVLSVDSNNK